MKPLMERDAAEHELMKGFGKLNPGEVDKEVNKSMKHWNDMITVKQYGCNCALPLLGAWKGLGGWFLRCRICDVRTNQPAQGIN